jgi:hypothetical protein
LIVLGLLTLLSTATAARQRPLEYDVKAAFVLNFVRYVEWPSTHHVPPLRLCVLDTNPFGTRLQTVTSGEQWQGAGIDVRVVSGMREGAGCHLLYVPDTAAGRFVAGISALSGLPVLTVGEHERFLEQGGMIRLFVEENRVRFAINQKAADSVGLLISSRLLRLARMVIGSEGGA